jgi:outer membrane biosynthesis protein TonB
MNLPTPTNPCFHLRHQVYPRYPADASPADRLAPELTVKVAFFVGADGSVQGSYVLESDAGPTFAAVVLEAVDHWLYDPDFASCADPAGFWNILTVTFRNPQPQRSPVVGGTAGLR